mgnify:CR=1 FL=1
MNLIKQIWTKLNDPFHLWGYAISCLFMLLTAFTVKTFNYSIVFTIIKVIVVVFSVFIYSKVISKIIKNIKNKT